MARLKMTVESASTTLTVDGDVYAQPREDGDQPEVHLARAWKDSDSHFQLGPGKYQYEFDVMNGSGELTLTLKLRDGDVTVASKKFPETPTTGLVFAFKVPQGAEQ